MRRQAGRALTEAEVRREWRKAENRALLLRLDLEVAQRELDGIAATAYPAPRQIDWDTLATYAQ